MRAFFANLMFSMITSVLWSLCFEMPFITIDGILLSGRKENLSKDLRTNNSAASDKDICQPKESSTTHVNNDPKEHGCDATLHDVTKTAKQNDVQDEKINKTAERENNERYPHLFRYLGYRLETFEDQRSSNHQRFSNISNNYRYVPNISNNNRHVCINFDSDSYGMYRY